MLANDQEKIQPLLNLFDSIQEILQNCNEIDLPKIVVIGDQSSGKSSVLESIAQINLPRGENTVTRSPISIQMRYSEEKYAEINYTFDEELYSESGSQQIKQIFSNFDEIDQELRKATENILKTENKENQVTQTQINLKLQSPQMPNLTLIDLPGLTYKNVMFSEAVKQMYRKYIQNPSTLILVVMPADQDLTNTEANIIAAEKDPQKQRTLGIVTKIDRHMSRFGQKLLNNDLKYDSLGIFLVRNRTQDELESKIEYSEVRKREQLILQEQEFSFHPSSQKGTKALISMLIKLQNDQVMKEKLRVRDDIVQKLRDIKKQLQALPQPCSKVKQKSSMFYKMLRQFQQDIDNLYSGNYGNQFTEKADHLRARVDEMFEEHSTECYKLQNNYLNSESRKQIQNLMEERKGVELYNFLSFQCFTENFKNQIHKLTKPSEDLLSKVFNYLKNIYSRVIEKNFSKFSDLEQILKRELAIFLLNLEEKIADNLKLQFEKESVVIFTKNPLYLDVLYKIKCCIKQEIEKKQDFNNRNQANQLLQMQLSGPSKLMDQSLFMDENQFQIYDLSIPKKECAQDLFKTGTSTLSYQTTEMQLSLFSYSNTLFKRLMDSIYQEILYQICLLGNSLSEFFEDKFSPVNGSHCHESCLWISNPPQIETQRASLEKNQKILISALAKFEDFEKN